MKRSFCVRPPRTRGRWRPVHLSLISSRTFHESGNWRNMPFDLPGGYLLGLLGWLIALAASLPALMKLRRKIKLRLNGEPRRTLFGLSLWFFLAALTVVELCFAIIYDQTDSFNMSNVSQHWFARHVRDN